MRKKYARLGLGALGSWAAGGAAQSKSYEQELEEARANAISGHRESVLWYLRQKLQECGSFQASMMEKRILREVEKNRSVLANARPGAMPEFGGFEDVPVPPSKYKGSGSAHLETQAHQPEEELSPEQIQMFEKQNQDMLKHYESTLDQVRYVEFMACRSVLVLTHIQDSGKVFGRNIRAADATGEQSCRTICTYRPTGVGFFFYSGECRGWKQAVEESCGTKIDGQVRLLCILLPQSLLGGMGSGVLNLILVYPSIPYSCPMKWHPMKSQRMIAG